MLSTLRVFLLILVVAVLGLILQGCASGVRVLGEVSIADGIVRRYIQIGSEGHDSARLTVIESFDIHTDAAGNIRVKQANDPIVATTDGLVGKVVQGTGAAALAAGGQVGAAYLRKPDLYNSTTVQSGGGGGGAVATGTGGVSSSNSGSSSVASSNQKQGQAQIQGQKQSSRNSNRNSNRNRNDGGGESCRGNCD